MGTLKLEVRVEQPLHFEVEVLKRAEALDMRHGEGGGDSDH